MKKTILLGAVLVGMGAFFLTGCTTKKASSSVADYQEKGVVIGLDDSFVPMGFRDDKGELVGFDIELAKAVGEELGMKVKFQPIDWSMKETELENKTIDMIWNGYTVTEERENMVAFSQPYLKNQQVVVTMKKNKINKIEQMNGKTLGVQEGSSGEESFNQAPELLKDNVKNQTAISFPAYTEAFLDLEAGRIEGLLIDKIFADYYLAQKSNQADFVLVETGFPEESYAIGFRKADTTLVKAVDEAMVKIIEEGEAAKISQKWFGEDRIVK